MMDAEKACNAAVEAAEAVLAALVPPAASSASDADHGEWRTALKLGQQQHPPSSNTLHPTAPSVTDVQRAVDAYLDAVQAVRDVAANAARAEAPSEAQTLEREVARLEALRDRRREAIDRCAAKVDEWRGRVNEIVGGNSALLERMLNDGVDEEDDAPLVSGPDDGL